MNNWCTTSHTKLRPINLGQTNGQLGQWSKLMHTERPTCGNDLALEWNGHEWTMDMKNVHHLCIQTWKMNIDCSSGSLWNSPYHLLLMFENFHEVLQIGPMIRRGSQYNYEWAKWTRFILAVVYGSSRRRSNSSIKPLKKSEKIEINLYAHFRTSPII